MPRQINRDVEQDGRGTSGQDGTWASMLRALSAGEGSFFVRIDGAFEAGGDAGHAFGVGVGVCWAWAREQHSDGRNVRTSGRSSLGLIVHLIQIFYINIIYFVMTYFVIRDTLIMTYLFYYLRKTFE